MELPLSSPCVVMDGVTLQASMYDNTYGTLPPRKAHPNFESRAFVGASSCSNADLSDGWSQSQAPLEVELIPKAPSLNHPKLHRLSAMASPQPKQRHIYWAWRPIRSGRQRSDLSVGKVKFFTAQIRSSTIIEPQFFFFLFFFSRTTRHVRS